MNTKTNGISSGLVAVAWMAEDEDGDLEFNTINEFSCGRTEGTPLVRLSDAEAIIAQKDAEILEQCRINGMGAEREAALLGKVAQQSAALKLAKDALELCDVGDCSTSYVVMPSFDAVAIDEALAAIDEVLGE